MVACTPDFRPKERLVMPLNCASATTKPKYAPTARSRMPGRTRLFMVDLFFDDSTEKKPAEGPINCIECSQQPDPWSELLHRIAEDDQRRCFDRRQQRRNDQRKEEQRQEGLLRADLRGHRRVEGSRRRETGGAEGDDEEELQQLHRAGVVEDDHDREERAAEEDELEPVRQRLAVVDDARADREEDQPLQGAVLHLGVEALREGEGGAEEKAEPHEAGGELPEHLRVRPHREAEEEQRRGAED